MTQAKPLSKSSLHVVLDKLYEELNQGSFTQPEILLAVATKL